MNNLSLRRLRPGVLALLLFPFSFLLVPTSLSAQLSRHGNVWYFGYGAGVDFSSGQPVKLTGINVDSYEGCAIYCDSNGQVLFYTNGGGIGDNSVTGPRQGLIWNRDQQVMYDLDTVKGGGYSAAQSALVLPSPANPDRYFLFTMDHNPNADPATNRGLAAYEIDMTAAGGLGQVVAQYPGLHIPATECLTAVPRAAGDGFWVITVDKASGDFVLETLSTNALSGPAFKNRQDAGDVIVLKASPDGRWVCANGELYGFDAATGNFSFRAAVPASTYTLSFSPASRYLYAFESDNPTAPLLRYDLEATDIPASTEVIIPEGLFSFQGLMQLGPDGNIYYIEQLEEDLLDLEVSFSAIRCPDGLAPSVEHGVFKFETDPLGIGLFTSLPNFADYIFAQPPVEETVSVDLICDSSAVLAPAQPGVSYEWSTGATTPTITVSEADTVSVTVQDSCGFTTTTFLVREACCNPQFPNAFTPNGDTFNDTFAPVLENCDLDLYEFNVYSRWGELIFQSFRTAERWDGTVNGNPAPSDSYIYTVKYKRKDETETKMQQQSVTLLR